MGDEGNDVGASDVGRGGTDEGAFDSGGSGVGDDICFGEFEFDVERDGESGMDDGEADEGRGGIDKGDFDKGRSESPGGLGRETPDGEGSFSSCSFESSPLSLIICSLPSSSATSF